MAGFHKSQSRVTVIETVIKAIRIEGALGATLRILWPVGFVNDGLVINLVYSCTSSLGTFFK